MGAVSLLIGHFLPWAAHSTAALTQSGHDLAISTNFTPGAGIFANEWFFVPVWAAGFLLALTMHTTTLPPMTRLIGLALALGMVSLGLPTYPQVLTAWQSPDYRAQFFVTLVVMALVLWVTLRRRPTAAGDWRFLSLGCAVMCAVPLIGYPLIKPAIETLYQDAVGLGAGWWVSIGAVIALLVDASATIMGSSIGSSPVEASHPATRPR